MKNYLGECNLTVTRPNGEWSEILVSNPGRSTMKQAIVVIDMKNVKRIASLKLFELIGSNLSSHYSYEPFVCLLFVTRLENRKLDKKVTSRFRL